ncbi:sulfatase-like hydrolase/transferase [Alteromonas oceanisediminis]|uniref:sulfatase-like hydrolase/transferase n=1 Tax=Alteromonas oceanisediminis TaxID=2836180 RepID=UPI001BD9A17E|nr:sulfatase-like hydrolase/transferase [Alteromonas oceanisediminis]MBT0587843.1 sulfatase-like hydrolase/transferase [Alteromonas oceanisediminis]
MPSQPKPVAPAPPPEPAKPTNVIVFFTDDQGYADIGIHNQRNDIRTPNIDSLANDGVLFTNGYVTSPQCSPSRAALITGRYQQRIGYGENKFGPLSVDTDTLADRFKSLGYTTGMMGKWHLELQGNMTEWLSQNLESYFPGDRIDINQVPLELKMPFMPESRGFDYVFDGYYKYYWTNMQRNGTEKASGWVEIDNYRIDVISDAAVGFINSHHEKPFFLHVAHYGPHVPIEATQELLDQFPDDMPIRRKYALATMLGIDNGVGKVIQALKEHDIFENTLIVFMSDNGAPLDTDRADVPLDSRSSWNGSRNDPLRGEKGMLMEGGIKVPYIIHYPRFNASGIVIDEPVLSLDAVATALKLVGGEIDDLDGIDLRPAISGDREYLNERPMFFRFQNQRAIRQGRWKYLEAGWNDYLFDMYANDPEANNMIEAFPDIAEQMKNQYFEWSGQMPRPDDMSRILIPFQMRYDYHLDPERDPTQ